MLCAGAMRPQYVSDAVISRYFKHQAVVGVTNKHTDEHE